MQWLLRTRLGVVLAFGVLFLALDVGRSIWARVGLAHPSAEYRPDPALYADLTWPPGADVDPGAPLGSRIFAQHCAVCHGPDGRGNGPAAPSMFPRPRDFSSGKFKYKSTAAGEPPADEDLLRTVRDGLPASAMPYFAGVLSTESVARRPLGPGQLRRLDRPHSGMGKGRQLRRCGIYRESGPARRLPYPLGTVRPLP